MSFFEEEGGVFMKKLIFLALVLCLAVSANAGYLQWGTEITGFASSSPKNGDPIYSAVNALNGNGLADVGGAYPGHSTAESLDHFVAKQAGQTAALGSGLQKWWILPVLDQVRTIDSLHLWNSNSLVTQGWKDVEIYTTITGNWSGEQVLVWSGVLPEAPTMAYPIGPSYPWGDDTYEGFDIDLLVTDALEISIEASSCWSGSYDVLLGEVWVHEVPEPTTIALLGLGGLALLRRKRN